MVHVINGLNVFAENPSDFSVTKYDPEEKKMILQYMRSFEVCGVGGHIDDCRTGRSMKETNSFYNDGDYMWSKQDIYHIEKYDAAVDPGFAEHVKRKEA